jgi:hypothetical protein
MPFVFPGRAAAAAGLLLLVAATVAHAATSGVQLSPDGKRRMVSKDVGTNAGRSRTTSIATR